MSAASRLRDRVLAAALAVCSASAAETSTVPAAAATMIAIPGGTFTMGDAGGEPDETPHVIAVRAFKLMRHEVTNDEFAAFVAATGHVTDPERSGEGYVWTDQWRASAARTGAPAGPGQRNRRPRKPPGRPGQRA
ncbi:MAG: SUMF1/EgtB/PvdO family nonheme iron enzyme [Gammaproteobacteria bacterium]|nr:SUMF1/EgtB/PvdO family nonheme iron enzyme [Gammaproteobacteria bacterium]